MTSRVQEDADARRRLAMETFLAILIASLAAIVLVFVRIATHRGGRPPPPPASLG